MARQIVTEIVADPKKFGKGVDEAVGHAGRFGSAMSGIGAGLGLGVFNVAKDALNTFVGSLGAADEAFRKDEASQVLLANALRNTVPAFDGSTKAVESYADAQQRLGFMDDDVRASIGQLVGITHDQTKAMQLSALAQDLARAKGIDLATATDVVSKAAQGNGKALKAMGIDISGAKDAAGMLDAIQKNVKGSAEAWAASSDGKVAVAAAKQDAAWEKIGSIVNKVSSVLLPALTDAFSGIADILASVSEQAQPMIDQMGKALPGAFKAVGWAGQDRATSSDGRRYLRRRSEDGV
jgi:hypothetical protein